MPNIPHRNYYRKTKAEKIAFADEAIGLAQSFKDGDAPFHKLMDGLVELLYDADALRNIQKNTFVTKAPTRCSGGPLALRKRKAKLAKKKREAKLLAA